MLSSTKRLFLFFSVLMLIVVVWLTGFFYFVSETVPSYHSPKLLHSSDDANKPEAIVVLTGGRMRLTEAINLLTEGKADRLFISGVGENTDLITTLILSGPLPDGIHLLLDNIELGHEARNTRGNAIETAQWAEKNNIHHIYLVTANYHMPRSVLLFKQYAKDLKITTFPVVSPGVEVKNWLQDDGSKRLLVGEYNKYIATILQNFIGWN